MSKKKKMAKNGDNEVVKHFVWKFSSQEDADLFDKFRLVLLTQSCSVELKMLEIIRQYVNRYEVDFTPMLESTALDTLAKEGIETTRPTLKKYRDKGVLVDDDGSPFWYTDGHAIAYNYEKLKDFVLMRKELGVEPLVA